MKAGDKVFHGNLGRDVVFIEDGANGKATVYDNGSYIEVYKSSLLEYSTKQHVVRPNPAAVCGPTLTQTKKSEGVVGKMNVRSLMGEFGKVKNGEVALTFAGQVVIRRNADEYVCYDPKTQQIVNHMSLVFADASKFMFILPVAEVVENDVIKFKGDFYQVLKVNENGSIHGINITKGTKSTICKETNALGFNFYYKVTSLFPQAGTAGNAIGGIDPIMLLLLGKDGGSDVSEMLPLLLMSQGATAGVAQNPLLMMSLLGEGGGFGGDMKDLLMLQALSGQTAGAAGAFNPMLLMALSK